jgi:hypothetical protein
MECPSCGAANLEGKKFCAGYRALEDGMVMGP